MSEVDAGGSPPVGVGEVEDGYARVQPTPPGSACSITTPAPLYMVREHSGEERPT